MLRLPYLNEEWCSQFYESATRRVAAFEFRNQSSWYGQAYSLIQVARLAYAMGRPLAESRSSLRESVVAFKELFALRGQTCYTFSKHQDGKPGPQQKIFEDGYSSKESFHAGIAALIVHNPAVARELVDLAGHSPNAQLVSPTSEVCTSNEQTLSHALNALLAGEFELAQNEARKLEVRRCTRTETRLGAVIAAIATQGDVLGELEALIAHHERTAKRRENWLTAEYFLCLPALGLTNLAIAWGRLEYSDLNADHVFAPAALLRDTDEAEKSSIDAFEV